MNLATVQLHTKLHHDEDGVLRGVEESDLAECGTCHRVWCFTCSPTPSARCPFEYEHSEPATAPKTDAERSADTSETSALTAQVQALTSQIHAMQDDLATIGEHLKKTADRHEWCGEYEEHLSRLVADLSEHSAKTLHDAAKRLQTYSVTYSFTQEVEACDEAQARRIVEDRYELRFAGDWRIEEV